MNRYTVVYLAEAEDNLIAIWADTTDRGQVTESADAADRLFAENPLGESVYLSEQLRRRDLPPLRFYFEVREEDRVVVISNVVRLQIDPSW
jgi:plasmid stabilization system protein ParE